MAIKDLKEIQTLYKYRYFDCDNYHIKTILDNEFYFPSKKDLNDPFDLSLRPRYELATVEQLLNHARYIVDRANFVTDEEKAQRWQEVQIEIKYHKCDYIERYIKIFEDSMSKVGICSFTADIWNEGLMWAHYGREHTGFCIGLNWLKLYDYLNSHIDQKYTPFIVDYGEDQKIINPFIGNELAPYKTAFTYKSKIWEYENEVRLINLKGSKSILKVPNDIIEEIILGLNCSEPNQNVIKNILKIKNSTIKLYQIKQNDFSFELVKEEIDYRI
ncbi:MAG: DUF2971 domain-containing protein [bacterium]